MRGSILKTLASSKKRKSIIIAIIDKKKSAFLPQIFTRMTVYPCGWWWHWGQGQKRGRGWGWGWNSKRTEGGITLVVRGRRRVRGSFTRRRQVLLIVFRLTSIIINIIDFAWHHQTFLRYLVTGCFFWMVDAPKKMQTWICVFGIIDCFLSPKASSSTSSTLQHHFQWQNVFLYGRCA